ncbi:E3 ubiquitin-protein ligase RNF126 isoform X5 [Tamandua tetradactyla]|uniref:E3 ubiquitin-protein ligase RNF126 isoform X5 n=1 Tax=Tamandua tetradactyla TaxID=48850 RepID=UPI0040549306
MGKLRLRHEAGPVTLGPETPPGEELGLERYPRRKWDPARRGGGAKWPRRRALEGTSDPKNNAGKVRLASARFAGPSAQWGQVIISAHDASLVLSKSCRKRPGTQTTVLPPPRHPRTRAGSLSRTWTSTCSHCRRAMGNLLSAFLTTALRFPRSPRGRRLRTAGTLRAGGSVSTSPGTAMAPGSPGPGSRLGALRVGMKASQHWKGSSSSWSMASSLLPPSPTWAWAPGEGVLHSNPMDYAWGANGLDAIITQV